MVRLNVTVLASMIFVALVSPVFASTSAKERLKESSAYFDKGLYQKALDSIKDIDIRNDFDNSDDMKLAFKIRAISYDQTDNPKEASETIRELYFIDPAYNFDPFDTPESLVLLARKVKTLIDEKSRQLASARNEAHLEQGPLSDNSPPEDSPKERTIFIEKKPHAVATLFPLGLNHFYLNSPLRGGIYLSMQTLGLVTNVAAYFWKQSYLDNYGSHRLKSASYQASFETAQMIQYIGFTTIVISYGISVIDALIRYKSMPTQKISSGEITL